MKHELAKHVVQYSFVSKVHVISKHIPRMAATDKLLLSPVQKLRQDVNSISMRKPLRISEDTRVGGCEVVTENFNGWLFAEWWPVDLASALQTTM